MEDTRECHLVRVGCEASPLIVSKQFVELCFQVGEVGAEDGEVICIRCSWELVLVILGIGEASKPVALASHLQPP